MPEVKLPPLPEREAFEAWMQGDATISLEKDGHGYVDMTAELMWHAWKARATLEAQGAPDHCDPSCTSYDLAAMAMSDCGHSTNNERLLDRIAARIDKHVEKVLSSLPPRQVPDSIEPEGWYESREQGLSEQRYCDGWNACRTAMLACAAPLTGGDERRHREGAR